jgi:ferredoxin
LVIAPCTDEVAIYYFSTTGNSLAVATHLAARLEAPEPISIPGSLMLADPYAAALNACKVGFVFPVHRATLPEMVRGFIARMPIFEDRYYFAISTYTLFSWNEFWDIDELLHASGARLNYTQGLRMMGNVGVGQPSKGLIRRRIAKADAALDECALSIANSQENYFRRALQPLGRLTKAFTDNRRKRLSFHVNSHCTRCGICAQVCPAQNITLGDGGAPVRSDKCQACFACVHWCPANAIGALPGLHSHYHHPDIKPEQRGATPHPGDIISE